MKEIHLIIVWSKASNKLEEISEDINKRFELLEKSSVTWTKNKFSENLTRFYGESLPKNSYKEKHCGNETFTCFIVRDNNPAYELRNTSKGPKVVNANLFDIKQVYRGWTGGGHKIHATDNIDETKVQLALLFSKDYSDYLYTNEVNKVTNHKKDLAGSDGWEGFDELFKILNFTSKYIILRNFDNLDEQLTSEHPDVDLLVENKDIVAGLINAKATTSLYYRAQYATKVKGKMINFDLRHIGDSYYCIPWQVDMLNSREKCSGYYIPNKEYHFFSLIYHALIHKPALGPDYIHQLRDMSVSLGLNLDLKDFIDLNLLDILIDYLQSRKYSILEPSDFSVYFNSKLLSKRIFIPISYERKLNRFRYLHIVLYRKARLILAKSYHSIRRIFWK